METSLVVERVAFGGKGLGRIDGKVCFVPWVIPGEVVSAHVHTRKKNYSEADLVSVAEPSPDRVEPRCAVFGRCGGCHYQHVSYPRQLVLKRDQVAEVLRRLGGLRDIEVEPVIPSSKEFHYRNRISVHVKGGRIGFYEARSRKIVDVRECPIASPAVNELLKEFRTTHPRDGERALREPHPFRGFRQVNDFLAPALLELVAEFAAPGGEFLVDAYCGAGFFAKRLRPLFGRIAGIEWSVDAIRSAREDAGESEIFFLGDVRQHLAAALASGSADGTTLLLDPPAEGVDGEVIETILARPPARLIYVSCDPSTLARDIKLLSFRYSVKRVRPVDMFPQTAEIEVATLLERS